MAAPSPPSPPLVHPSNHLPLSSSENGKVVCRYQPALAHKVTAEWGTSSHPEARQDSPVKGMGCKGRHHSQRDPHSSCWGSTWSPTAHLYMCTLPRTSPFILIGWFSLCEPHKPRLVDSVGIPEAFGSLICSPNSSKLCLMFDCGSLQLFASAAGWGHPEEFC